MSTPINDLPAGSRQLVAEPPFWGSKFASLTTPDWQQNPGRSYLVMVVGVLALSAVLGGLFLGVQSLAENGSEWVQKAAGYGFQYGLLLLLFGGVYGWYWWSRRRKIIISVTSDGLTVNTRPGDVYSFTPDHRMPRLRLGPGFPVLLAQRRTQRSGARRLRSLGDGLADPRREIRLGRPFANARGKESMMNALSRGIAGLATTLALSGGLGLAVLVAGSAQAAPPTGPYTWCPGDDPGGGPGGPFNSPGPPNWDWNICHTFYTVNWGQGNVSLTIWDGENPPPDNRGPVGPCSLLDTRGC